MYRLMIVDDENTTRNSLQELIPWYELGIGEVVTAKNGIIALELAQSKQPDILLTDIRMPKMDGLELAKTIREQFPQCQIIFLSGYADKAYLKTAIQLKAVSYIEKPLNPEEIKAVIQETVALCDKEQQRNQTFTKLQDNLNDSKPLLGQALILELVNDGINHSELITKYDGLDFRLNPDNYYTVIYIDIFWNSGLNAGSIHHAKQSLLDALASGSAGDPAGLIAGFDPNDNLILICRTKTATSPAFRELFDFLNTHLTPVTQSKNGYAAGVGSINKGLEKIPQSHRNAVTASTRQFYSNSQQIFYFNDPYPGSTLEIDKTLFADFKNALRDDRFEKAQSLVRKLTDQIAASRESDLNRVKNAYFHLLLAVYDVALERKLIDPFNEREEKYIWQELTEKRSLAELAEYVLTVNDMTFKQLAETGAPNRKIQEVTRYIREHFADKNMSIQTISAQVYLSPTYLCAFFKKSTGKTLNEFITDTRIAKAKELLQDQQMKLYEISANVGFTDVNYFSTLFKRRVGCTPSEFREKYYR
ncbi:MAG TPA: response regulator [Bacillota bacterium]|nr:response regulator [Bacillota bacterium]